jgi:small ligand-binding sensory domain FIST
MKWASVLSRPEANGEHSQSADLTFACEQIKQSLGSKDVDLVLIFVASQLAPSYGQIASQIYASLTPKALIGCSAGGVIGGGVEIEQQAGLAICAASLPEVAIHSFYLEDKQLPDLDASPSKWESLIGVKSSDDPSFILLPDPFTFRIESLIEGLDFAFPKSSKIGGLASGASEPGKNALFLNDRIFKKGLVGVAVAGNVVLETIVAQGCKPVGRPLRVTKCDNNVLMELDGKPAVTALKEVLDGMSDYEQSLARHSLFLGVVMDEFKSEHKGGDFLIRNLIGIEPSSGALVVGEILRNERTVQFHVRDAATSSEDLRLVLKRYVEKPSPGPAREGALLFSCLGRGTYLYGQANHDSDGFRQYVGDIPLSGFFCNGEIGPIGGTTFVHGYTSSFGIFKAKTNKSSSRAK